ncbi:MAG TPA: DUF1501 domain-containing protein [Pirellulales bacterium]|jgi:hypothetical protein|nr:DUF1501 domain-containing protein [Pirellulales bacterium]
MFSIWERTSSRTGVISRRALLKIGSLAVGGLSLGDMLRLRAQGAAQAPPDTAVIHVFMGGGPSHIDLYDLKPAAPAEVRGEFKPISTALAGVQISEHLPHLAATLGHVALVRSMAHANAGHLPASHWMMTGYQPPPSTTSNVNPYCGAVVSHERGPNVPGMPAYVSIPRRQLLGAASYLGPAYNPFTTESDPNSPKFSVQNLGLPQGMDVERLRDREGLLKELDRLRRDVERQGELAGVDKFSREALEIITSPRAHAAFDLSREPASLRERYGRTQAGQGCLLARRLVEAGVTFVTVLSGGEWDTHRDNFTTLKDRSLPPVDQALATLIADLHERGLDRRVLLLVSGEFGRTPKINPFAGRDHWPGAFSVLFAGGGLKVGQVVGETDETASRPITRPYSPGDMLATVYHFLGIDTAREFLDRSGRPMRVLAEGEPIPELIA